MLKLTDNGAKITLHGQPVATDNGLFWFASALLIGAVGVAMAMSILSERLAIGALALLIVGSFIFNHKRQQRKKSVSKMISHGVLWVSANELVHEHQGKRDAITLQAEDNVAVVGEQLEIADADQVLRYRISGFDNLQETKVTQAILQGQTLNKRHVNIKMNAE